MNRQPVSYIQTDKRWASKLYAVKGEVSTIGGSGCGPTAMAMVLATWADPKVTPETECAWALAHGYKALRHGTYYAYFAPAARRYGLTCTQLNSASIYGNGGHALHATVLAALRQGDLVIACMGPGNWTRGGHFVLLWDVQGDVAYINDPASRLPGRTRGSWALFKQQVKFYFRIRHPETTITKPEEAFEVNEKELASLVEQTIKVNLKNYIRDALIEANADKAAEPEPEWSRSEGLWAEAVRLGVTDGSRPCAPASRCEVVTMMLRLSHMRQRTDEESRRKAEEMGLE